MKKHPCITPELQAWIGQQHVFFVASAPLSRQGHVNVSPKGLDCLRILHEHAVCYMDMTGSGNETSAHIAENQRLTLMFCAFTGAPRILRLYGKGRVVLRDTQEFDKLVQTTKLPVLPSARQIIVCQDIDLVITSCGYAVPKYDFVQHRSTHTAYVEARAETDPDMVHYQQEHNLTSLDGIVTPLGVKYGTKEKHAVGKKRRYILILVSVAVLALAVWGLLYLFYFFGTAMIVLGCLPH